MEVYKGTIVGIDHTIGSGLAHLHLKDDKGSDVVVHCEAGQTFRALSAAFGDSVYGPVGKEIYFTTDRYGVMASFSPVDDAPPELVRMYEEAIP